MKTRKKYKVILITGVAGFMGSNVTRYFAKKGCVVTGVDTTRPGKDILLKLKTFYKIDLTNPLPSKIFQQDAPQLCIHCAGPNSPNRSMKDPLTDFSISAVATFNVLNALRAHAGHCRLLLISSAAVYGNPGTLPIKEIHAIAPVSPYGFHKAQCEQLCQEFNKLYGIPTAAVRIFSAYGNGLKRQVIWDICDKVSGAKIAILQGTGNESRDFIHILDICRGLEVVADFGRMNGDVYNLATGREATIREVAHMVIRALKKKGAAVEFNNTVPPGVPLNWRADITKIKRIGFKPSVTLEDGIGSFVEYYQRMARIFS